MRDATGAVMDCSHIGSALGVKKVDPTDRTYGELDGKKGRNGVHVGSVGLRSLPSSPTLLAPASPANHLNGSEGRGEDTSLAYVVDHDKVTHARKKQARACTSTVTDRRQP